MITTDPGATLQPFGWIDLSSELAGMLVLSWKSYLIRDEGVTTFDDYIASHFERANGHEEGIVFNPWKSGPYPTWGMPALKASKAAALQGKEKWRSFHLALMKAFYTEGRDISKSEVIEAVAMETGLLDSCIHRRMQESKVGRPCV